MGGEHHPFVLLQCPVRLLQERPDLAVDLLGKGPVGLLGVDRFYLGHRSL